MQANWVGELKVEVQQGWSGEVGAFLLILTHLLSYWSLVLYEPPPLTSPQMEAPFL